MLYYNNMNEYMNDEEIRRAIRKKRKRKRLKIRIIVLGLLAIIMIVSGTFAGRAIGNSRYQKELSKTVPVIGNEAIVKVAKSQLGNIGGEPYWSWHGFADRVEWCASFASWCADQCGYLESGKAPSFALVNVGHDWFKNHDQALDGGETPSPGDLIFFSWKLDGSRDHVGIVTAVVDDKVFTIEGNSSDMCRQKRYYLDDPVILGYGHIK